jgi:glycosyltransferase involved in cell wall biosynthesis
MKAAIGPCRHRGPRRPGTGGERAHRRQGAQRAGDEVRVIFDGAGTQWPGVLSDPQHKSPRLWESVADTVAGAYGYYAGAFDATDGLPGADLRAGLAPRGKLLVGYLGRLAPRKRVHLLAAVCGLPGVRLVVVGDGPSQARSGWRPVQRTECSVERPATGPALVIFRIALTRPQAHVIGRR